MLVRSQSYILLFAMLTKRKTIISKAIFSLFFFIEGCILPGCASVNNSFKCFFEKERNKDTNFFFQIYFLFAKCQHPSNRITFSSN